MKKFSTCKFKIKVGNTVFQAAMKNTFITLRLQKIGNRLEMKWVLFSSEIQPLLSVILVPLSFTVSASYENLSMEGSISLLSTSTCN